ncbi:MAG: hypothetical protein L3J26_11285 [Candidatus Polarisedimenticolaceae bacterium]|nr:hypothetical protein [Candidatus Polarisedimenticolaceae bacterium]
MHLSDSEWYTALIFLVAAIKITWDIWASSAIFAHCSKEKSGGALTKEVKAKRQRDNLSGFISFAAIAIFTGLIIGGGIATKELTREEFELHDKRVEMLESYFTPPDGGAPVNFYALLKNLDGRLSHFENIGISKEDIKKLKKDSSDLKKIIAEKEKANEYVKQLRKNGDVTLFD